MGSPSPGEGPSQPPLRPGSGRRGLTRHPFPLLWPQVQPVPSARGWAPGSPLEPKRPRAGLPSSASEASPRWVWGLVSGIASAPRPLSVRLSIHERPSARPPAGEGPLPVAVHGVVIEQLSLAGPEALEGRAGSVWAPGPVLGQSHPARVLGSLAWAGPGGGVWPPSRGARPGPPGVINAAAPAPLFSWGGAGAGGGTAPALAPGECLSYRSQASLVPASVCSDISGVYLLLLVSQ